MQVSPSPPPSMRAPLCAWALAALLPLANGQCKPVETQKDINLNAYIGGGKWYVQVSSCAVGLPRGASQRMLIYVLMCDVLMSDSPNVLQQQMQSLSGNPDGTWRCK
jgi:hypothetical protein